MMFNLKVTPVGSDGRSLAATELNLTLEDVRRRDFGTLLRPLLLDWFEIAQEIDQLTQAEKEGELVVVSS